MSVRILSNCPIAPRALVIAIVWLTACSGGLAADLASYSGLNPDEFLKTWLVLKPVPVNIEQTSAPDEAMQKKAFAEDALLATGWEINLQPRAGLKQRIGDRELQWQLLQSRTDRVDLAGGGANDNFAAGYAWAEIEMPQKTKGVLGLGSDDAIKVWLNGKLIHENWVARSARADDDLVPVEFLPGKNRLLLKIQNIKDSWGFLVRLIGPQTQAQELVSAIWNRQDTKDIARLLEKGLDINSHTKAGLTPIMAARLRGDAEMAEFLASRGAESGAEMPPRENLAKALFTRLIQPEAAGAAVLVAQNGKVLFEQGFGLADFDRHESVTPETKFRIGSITKQFTATAILKLQEEGKLSVQDKLSKYIPDFPRGDEVTLHHLLTHTSGIHSYTSKPHFMETVTTPVKPEDLINSFKDDPYDFAPGAKWLYDNSGFFLLGYIIEKVSGQTYADFLRQRLFEPLGMTNTGVYRSDLALEHEALGYQLGADGKFTRALNWDMSRAGGAGALYSTVGDLFRWNEAVFNGKVLKPDSLKAAFTPVKPDELKDDHSESGYGYGWGINSYRGAQEISHGGGLHGFSTYILRLPKHNFTVVVLANALPGAPGVVPGQLARELTEFYLGEKLDPLLVPIPNEKVSSQQYSSLEGRYDYGTAILTVTRESDHLFAQLSDQPRFEIYPKSDTDYFWKAVDAQITFVKDAAGKVIKAIHHQNGQVITAPRVEDVKEVQVDPAEYDALLGNYDYGGGKAILTVSRSGRQLFAQLTGQPKVEIFPKSATEFFWKIVDAQITFVKSSSGKVTKAIHHQGGQTFEAPKLE